MNLTERFFEMTADVREQAAAYAARSAEMARSTVDNAAERVEAVATPIENLTTAATRFNKLAYDYANSLISHQANVVTGALQDGAERLRMLNKAGSLQQAYKAQLKYFDVTRDRMTRDAKTAWQLLTQTGAEIQTLANTTWTQLRTQPQSARRSAARVRKTVHKTARRARKAA
jgi:hypothetical protein